MKGSNNYSSSPLTLERILVEDANRIGKKIPFIHSLWDVDITDVRLKIKTFRRKNKCTLSVSTYLLFCYAATINEQKQVHACKNWLNKFIVFDDIDVFFPMEVQNKTLIPKVIRSVNRKSIIQLEEEIIQTKNKAFVELDARQKIFLRFPKFLRDFIYNIYMKNPILRKDAFGTSYFTSTSTSVVSNNMGFGIPIPMHTIGLCLGSVESKTILLDNQVCTREFMGLTVSVDHGIIDGASLVRFNTRLRHNILHLIDNL